MSEKDYTCNIGHVYISAPEMMFQDEKLIEQLKLQTKNFSFYLADRGQRSKTYMPQLDNKKLFIRNPGMLRDICNSVIARSNILYVPVWGASKWQKNDLKIAIENGLHIYCNENLADSLKYCKAQGVAV